jgi:DNA repair protein SbcD/Mre11
MPKLLHTADWHLGKRLHDFRLLREQREALERLLDVVDTEAPDLVVVAGDVFDVPVPPLEALETWDWLVEALVDARGVPLVVVPGNHDHAVRLAMNARLARHAGLHVLSDLDRCHLPVRVAGVDVFGLPFHKPAHVRACAHRGGAVLEVDDFDYDGAMTWLLGRARAALDPTVPSLLVAHAFVAGGGEEPEGEDAVMVGGAGPVLPATLAGFDYVALGHLHAPRALPGHEGVRYAGSLYPYAFGEDGAKSVTIVDLPEASGTPASVRTLPLTVERRVRVVTDRSFDEVIADATAAHQAGDPAVDDYLLVRVTDRGPLHHALDRLREVHPHALLEQPVTDVQIAERKLPGDARTVGLEEAFLAFYADVFGDGAPSELELRVLRDAIAAAEAQEDAA